ncbi:MAG: RdgB/HAM1 family non-canonical purine NTP pyrophosphatase [Flavobacteriales bacterium]
MNKYKATKLRNIVPPRELIFATNNKFKLDEIRSLAGKGYRILSLLDIGFSGDIPETGSNLTENALQKAVHIHNVFAKDCFADDTGLEVDVLDGRPGVFSARYAGPLCNSEDNINKLLNEMAGVDDRKARFKTVIALVWKGREMFFEGVVEGEILTEPLGRGGFGYDPIFRPKGFDIAFAQMSPTLKNSISHRGKAVQKLIAFFNTRPSSE